MLRCQHSTAVSKAAPSSPWPPTSKYSVAHGIHDGIAAAFGTRPASIGTTKPLCHWSCVAWSASQILAPCRHVHLGQHDSAQTAAATGLSDQHCMHLGLSKALDPKSKLTTHLSYEGRHVKHARQAHRCTNMASQILCMHTHCHTPACRHQALYRSVNHYLQLSMSL